MAVTGVVLIQPIGVTAVTIAVGIPMSIRIAEGYVSVTDVRRRYGEAQHAMLPRRHAALLQGTETLLELLIVDHPRSRQRFRVHDQVGEARSASPRARSSLCGHG